MRSKIAIQAKMKYAFGATGMLSMAIYDQAVYKTLAQSQLRIVGAGVLGFFIGGYAAQNLTSTWIQPKIEPEIMKAHENRQVKVFMTVSGYNTNYTSADATSHTPNGPIF